MNEQLQSFARHTLKKGLSKCTEAQQQIFKRMYSHDNLGISLDEIINKMSENKLDWAMKQVQNTLNK